MRILDELVRQGKISELQMRAISALDIDADDEDELHKVLAQYGLNNQDILNLINSGKIHLESKPGTRFSYCNTNYA